MKDETVERRRTLLWALPASLILHALVTAFLVYGLPSTPQKPQDEQAVNVELVPPPDQPKPKPVPTPSPKKPEAEKPPEPKVEKPPEQKAEKPPAPENPSKIEVLKPVFQFGDKDTGPRKSLDGASAQDNAPPPAKDDDSKPPVVPKDAETKAAASPDSGESAKVDQKPAAAAKDIEPTQDAAAPATPLTAAGGDGEIELPTSAQAPQARPENAPKSAKVSKPVIDDAKTPSSADVVAARAYSGLPGVRKLYSKGATGSAFATTAMDGMTRDQRVDNLCASAMQQQLLDASYFPDLVPRIPVKTGNVFDVPNATFHAQGRWYWLSFRCESDTDATKVLSLNLRVGAAIPPDEQARLGLPDLR